MDVERIPYGKLVGGILADVLNEKATIAITRYGAIDAYVVPKDEYERLRSAAGIDNRAPATKAAR